MNTYKVKWINGVTETREATDMQALLLAMTLGERKPEPVSIEQVWKTSELV